MRGTAGAFIAMALLLIAFHGEPDLVDALIHFMGLEPTIEVNE